MGYIIDVTIVLEVLFWLKIGQPRLPSLSEDDIIAAFGMYQGTSSHLEVHSEIRKYVDNMTLLDHVKPDDKTHLEVERLINEHRRVLVDTIFADARRQPEPPQPPPPPPPSTSRVPKPQQSVVPEASGSQPPSQVSFTRMTINGRANYEYLHSQASPWAKNTVSHSLVGEKSEVVGQLCWKTVQEIRTEISMIYSTMFCNYMC